MSLFPEIRQLILKLLQVMCVLPLLHLEAAKRPNVLVILADDMGVGDVRSLNNESKIPTPNMDHLATEGLVFQDAHSASSIGALARYGMMTGRYCWRSDPTCRDVMGFDLPLIPAGRVTLGDLFKQKGYRTAYFGKWGLGLGWITRDGKPGKWDHGYNGTGESLNIDFKKPVTGGPKTLGFDYFFGIAASLDMPPYAYIENDITVGVPDKVTRAGGRQGLTVDGFRVMEVMPNLTQKVVRFLQDQGKKDPGEPFFLFVSLTAPHTPFVPTAKVNGLSQAGRYGDSVAMVDWSVGRILDTLKKTGLTEDTLVLLTSDNGSLMSNEEMEPDFGHRPSYLYRGKKGDPWEGGHRVPLLVKWPGEIEPGTCQEVISQTDFLATFAEILGMDLPENAGEDSLSFLPILQGKTFEKPIREAIIHNASQGSFAIREGKWKLILPPEHVDPAVSDASRIGQLYNLETDIGERSNLWKNNPALVERLRKLLEKSRSEGKTRKAS
ncbi:MAG: arylsulfatase [Opitutae bacterium]|nr:arylsulfatase [Opitutae bacterium]MBT4223753.1 arylsulfatase [Opitutae bacterium]MBT5378054.1 arylsulfatase [Opitutae bacterium]MBT5691553.1 arylsulfatase [Opitutae bacterium]MBT6461933.1 arylsulfatase [Opitutae bacterium]